MSIGQIKSFCKQEGLVYDCKSGTCRERKGREDIPEVPESRMSIQEIKDVCKREGLVYDRQTKQCREPYRNLA